METSVSFFLFCQLKPLLPSALGGGLGRPRRSGIPSPEGERRMRNSHLKVLHFDLESSDKLLLRMNLQPNQIPYKIPQPNNMGLVRYVLAISVLLIAIMLSALIGLVIHVLIELPLQKRLLQANTFIIGK